MTAVDRLCNYIALASWAIAEHGIELAEEERINTATRMLEMASGRPSTGNRYGRWTPKEDKLLRERYRPGSTYQDYAQIGAAIGRSVAAVEGRVRALGLTQGVG